MASDVPSDLQTALAERYELRRTLGRGGMATVYLAFDRKHQREVAIKVLLAGLAANLGAERFLKEIQIAARLTHPHILALHDSGDAAGFLYYVMPYIDGGSLRQQLEGLPGKTLGMEPALAIAAPVADALAYAHRMGIFHRDIKPENILFSQGHPIVADFGIAKAISTAGGANLTRTGFPVGTPGYMSPEQAAGMTDLDERTDVYSLAVVLYEMLVGALPGRWPTEEAVRAGRFLDAPPSHRARLTTLGGAAEGALVRGLAVRHDQRTASPEALIDEMRGVPASAPGRRRYSNGEVREIVSRAAELEASAPTMSGAMTIGGVEAIAAEVGIAPELVQRAADGIRTSGRVGESAPRAAPGFGDPSGAGLAPYVTAGQKNWFLGAPTRVFFERTVDGELGEDDLPELVDEIRRVLGFPGQVSQFGRTLTWSGMYSPGGLRRELEVAISVRAGRTRITVQEGLRHLVGGIYGGMMGGLGGGGLGPIVGGMIGGLGMHPAGVLVVIPLWLLTVFGVTRTTYYYVARGRERTLRWLADRLTTLTTELVGGHAGARAPWIAAPPRPGALPPAPRPDATADTPAGR